MNDASDPLSSCIQQGVAALQRNDFDAALTDFQAAVALQPHHSEAWEGCGVALLGKKDVASAIAHLDRAIQLDPQNRDAHSWRGHCYYSLQQYDHVLASPIQTAQAYF